jgi:hypothetical protein
MPRLLRKLATLSGFTVLIGTTALFGQATTSDPLVSDVADQLAKLNATLVEIADLLERALEGQRLGLVMERIQLSASRSANAEERLLTARTARDDLEEQKTKMKGQLEIFADRLDMGQIDMPAEDIEAMADESALQLELLESRIKSLDREIMVLENTLSRYQQELVDWQTLVDRRLNDY